MGIEDILLDGESLFRNISAFNPDYMPDNYNFRDSQMEAMAISIRPALNEGRPINSIILGHCATGKTTAVKKVFDLVEETSDKVVCCYINCQLHTTRFGIISQIHQKIFGHLPPETGTPFSRIYQRVMKELSDNKQALIVALDDVNYLFHNQHANKVFYDILRAYEIFPEVKTGIFAILSDLEFKVALDKNVNTVFVPQEILFSPYTRSEILTILTDRVNVGFYPNVISQDLIEQITDYTFESGDLRVGIDLLRVVGNMAESHASRAIEQKHLDESLSSRIPVKLTQTLSVLSKHEKSLLKIIIDYHDKDLSAGDLSKLFIKETNSSNASFSRILEKLEFLRLIDTKFTGKGVRGKSRQVILRFNPEDITKCKI
ncbi:ORC1-type DNA replication protein [Methanobrevibacter filiformis]|uniref:ORC1-type DNA replication protein n=1 Tax=Methanobrevibacter filiformis TaxID=55758 RepID=A0A166E2G9_9EURY|nr:ORC1-type DNA replication protein [Methanobrevibacter filiformis]KZX16206.1 cell division control protein 6 [Methanobrevibacter filiformis]